VASGHVLGGDAHVDVQARVVQGAEHEVQHLDVAHARTPAVAGDEVSPTAHGFSARADGHVAVTQQDGLRRGHHGLQARTAQAVHVKGGGLLGHAGVQGGHTADVSVLRHGRNHVAHDHVTHVLGLNASAFQRGLDDQGAQVGGRDVLERATETANGGTGGTNENDFTCHGMFSSGRGAGGQP